MIRAALILSLVLAQAAWASPTISKRPVQRGGNVVLPVEVAPSGAITPPVGDAQTQDARKPRGGLKLSLRPLFRSSKVEKQARAQRQMRAKGAVCGDVAIQGEAIGRVKGRLNGCGVENAVRVRSVSGVTLSQSAVMDCVTANALRLPDAEQSKGCQDFRTWSRTGNRYFCFSSGGRVRGQRA